MLFVHGTVSKGTAVTNIHPAQSCINKHFQDNDKSKEY